MVMPGQVLENCTACLRSFSAATRISAALLRSASDIIAVNSFAGWTEQSEAHAVTLKTSIAWARRSAPLRTLPASAGRGNEWNFSWLSDLKERGDYWQAARNTTVSTGHSALAVRCPCPCSHSEALHFSAVRTSSGWPSEKPLPLHASAAALAQSAAPL